MGPPQKSSYLSNAAIMKDTVDGRKSQTTTWDVYNSINNGISTTNLSW